MDRLLAALDQVLQRGLAVLDPWQGLCGFGDLVIEGLQAGEVWVAAQPRRGRQGGACLRVIGDGAGRLVISRGEPLVVGEDGVELLAQILELAAGAHFREDVLDPPIGFGGVADFGENSSRLLLLKRLQGGDDACGGLRDAANLFGVTPRLHAFGGESGELVPEPARRGRGVCRRRARGVDRGGRAGFFRGECGGGWRGAGLVLRSAKRVQDVLDGEAVQKGLRG